MGHFLLRHHTNPLKLSNNCLWRRMARMEIDYNVKTFGVFKFCVCVLQILLKNILWFALLTEIHLISSSWCSRNILCE